MSVVHLDYAYFSQVKLMPMRQMTHSRRPMHGILVRTPTILGSLDALAVPMLLLIQNMVRHESQFEVCPRSPLTSAALTLSGGSLNSCPGQRVRISVNVGGILSFGPPIIPDHLGFSAVTSRAGMFIVLLERKRCRFQRLLSLEFERSRFFPT